MPIPFTTYHYPIVRVSLSATNILVVPLGTSSNLEGIVYYSTMTCNP